MSVLNLHRKGKTFQESGDGIVFDPTKQEWNGMYLVQKQGKPLKVRKEYRSRLEWWKEDRPTEFKGLAEKIVIELVKYLTYGEESVELSRVYQEGAYLLKVSPETVKRYVFAHTATSAELFRVGKRVKINPYFKPMEDEEDDDE